MNLDADEMPNDPAGEGKQGDEPILNDAKNGTVDFTPPSTGQLSDTRLMIFGIGQTVLWAANAASSLETAFSLPVIGKDLGVTDGDAQWVVASFQLTAGCFLLIAGRLCDVYGRKRGYIIGCSTNILLNVLSTFMPNLASLNVIRGLCGVSSAVSLPASAGLIGALYPMGRKRTFAYAITCSGGAAGAALGQLIAGAFIQYSRWTWRPLFFLTGMTMIIPLCMAPIIPPDPAVSADRKVDWLGAFSVGTALFLLLLTFTLSETAKRGWSEPYIPVLLVASVVLFVLFALRQRQLSRASESMGNTKPPPIIPKSIISWSNRNLLIIYISSLATWGTIDSFFVFSAYLYIDVLHIPPLEAGLKFSVVFFSGSLAALIVALTISRVPPRALMSVALLISIISPILFAVRGTDWPYWKGDLWAFLVLAYGTDATISAGCTLISQTASAEDQSMASALFQTSLRLGYALGLAIATLVRTNVESKSLAAGDLPNDASLQGLRAGFWTLVGYEGFAFLVVALGMQGWHRLDRHETVRVEETGSGMTSESTVQEKI